MHTTQERIQFAFNKAAPQYNKITPVQKTVGEKLIACLPATLFEQVIDLGCGTGRTTQQLAHHIEFLGFEAIDLAECMIIQAQTQHPLSSIQFKTKSFDSLAENSYDLVFSNMALHWSINFSATLQHIYQALKSDGLIAFSIPLSKTLEELQSYYNIRNFYTVDEVSHKLHQAGFEVKTALLHHELLAFDTTLQALRTLKQTGATVCDRASQVAYQQCKLAIKQNKIKQLSYHIGLFIAGKP